MPLRNNLLSILCLVASACEPSGPPPPVGIWEPYAGPTEMWLTAPDFAGNFLNLPGAPHTDRRGPALGVHFAPATDPRLEDLLRDGLSLEQIKGGQNAPVDFDVRRGFFDPSGRGPEPPPVVGDYSVVPRVPLEEGWYVLRADLSAVLALEPPDPVIEGPRRGSVLHARVYVGSRPMWYSMTVHCGVHEGVSGRSCAYLFWLTEPMLANDLYEAAASIRVLYQGAQVTCPPLPGGQADGETRIQAFGCPEPVEGAPVEVSMPYAPIPDVRGEAEAVVSFVYRGPEFARTDFLEGPLFEARFTPHDDLGLEVIPNPGERP